MDDDKLFLLSRSENTEMEESSSSESSEKSEKQSEEPRQEADTPQAAGSSVSSLMKHIPASSGLDPGESKMKISALENPNETSEELESSLTAEEQSQIKGAEEKRSESPEDFHTIDRSEKLKVQTVKSSKEKESKIDYASAYGGKESVRAVTPSNEEHETEESEQAEVSCRPKTFFGPKTDKEVHGKVRKLLGKFGNKSKESSSQQEESEQPPLEVTQSSVQKNPLARIQKATKESYKRVKGRSIKLFEDFVSPKSHSKKESGKLNTKFVPPIPAITDNTLPGDDPISESSEKPKENEPKTKSKGATPKKSPLNSDKDKGSTNKGVRYIVAQPGWEEPSRPQDIPSTYSGCEQQMDRKRVTSYVRDPDTEHFIPGEVENTGTSEKSEKNDPVKELVYIGTSLPKIQRQEIDFENKAKELANIGMVLPKIQRQEIIFGNKKVKEMANIGRQFPKIPSQKEDFEDEPVKEYVEIGKPFPKILAKKGDRGSDSDKEKIENISQFQKKQMHDDKIKKRISASRLPSVELDLINNPKPSSTRHIHQSSHPFIEVKKSSDKLPLTPTLTSATSISAEDDQSLSELEGACANVDISHGQKTSVFEDNMHGLCLFCCTTCGLQFQLEEELLSHVEAHLISRVLLKDRLFACTVCSTEFESIENLQNHLVLHELKALHSCKYCNKTSFLESDVKCHEDSSHRNLKRYLCNSCLRKFDSKSLFDKHYGCYDVFLFVCGNCFFIFRSQTDLENHILQTHGDFMIITCPKRGCFVHFRSEEDYLRHKVTVHLDDRSIVGPGPNSKFYKCPCCEEETNSEEAFARHF